MTPQTRRLRRVGHLGYSGRSRLKASTRTLMRFLQSRAGRHAASARGSARKHKLFRRLSARGHMGGGFYRSRKHMRKAFIGMQRRFERNPSGD